MGWGCGVRSYGLYARRQPPAGAQPQAASSAEASASSPCCRCGSGVWCVYRSARSCPVYARQWPQQVPLTRAEPLQGCGPVSSELDQARSSSLMPALLTVAGPGWRSVCAVVVAPQMGGIALQQWRDKRREHRKRHDASRGDEPFRGSSAQGQYSIRDYEHSEEKGDRE